MVVKFAEQKQKVFNQNFLQKSFAIEALLEL